MKFAIVQPSQLLLDWVSTKIQNDAVRVEFDPARTRCTALFDENMEPVIVVLIDNITKHCCDVCIASDGTKRWNREFIRGTYEYIFDELRLNRMSMIVSTKNEDALRLHKRLRHIHEGTHRDFFGPGHDAISFSFLKSDYANSKFSLNAKNQ